MTRTTTTLYKVLLVLVFVMGLFSGSAAKAQDFASVEEIGFGEPIRDIDGVEYIYVKSPEKEEEDDVTPTEDKKPGEAKVTEVKDPAEGLPPESIEAKIYEIVVSFFGWLAGFTAWLLNYAINNFVISFGPNVTGTGVGHAINTLWSVVRDLFNILFIFSIIYLGFKMILGSDDTGTRKALAYLIVAALLVNFSLFISKFIVDFSNIIASEVATAAFNASPDNAEVKSKLVDVGTKFFQMMHLPQSVQAHSALLSGEVSPWGYILGITIVFVVASFAFLAGAILLIIRFGALCVFMVLSPFMFIGWILPQYKSTMDKYWSEFIGRAFFAPIYVIMLYFSAMIIQASFANLASEVAVVGGYETGIIRGAAFSLAAGIGPFILSTIMLIMSVQVATKLGSDGGAMATRFVKGGSAKVGRFAAQRTVGAVYRGVVNNGAEGMRTGLNRLNSSLSNSGVWGTRSLARLSDRTLGAGLDAAANSRIVGSETASERRKRVSEQNRRLNVTAQENKRSRHNDRYGRMSNEEVLRLSDEQLKDPEVLRQLTDAHMKAIEESGRMTNDEFDDAKELRGKAILDEVSESFELTGASADDLRTAFNRMGQTLKNMSPESLAGLGVDRLKEERAAVHLTERQIEQLEQSGKFSATQIQEIRDAKTAAQTAIATGVTNYGRGGAATVGVGLADFHENQKRALMANSQQAGELPPSIFIEPSMASFITPAALVQRENNGLSNTDRTRIENNIKSLSVSEYNRWVEWKSTPAGRSSRFDF